MYLTSKRFQQVLSNNDKVEVANARFEIWDCRLETTYLFLQAFVSRLQEEIVPSLPFGKHFLVSNLAVSKGTNWQYTVAENDLSIHEFDEFIQSSVCVLLAMTIPQRTWNYLFYGI